MPLRELLFSEIIRLAGSSTLEAASSASDPKAIAERAEDINVIADELNEFLNVDRTEVLSKMEDKESQEMSLAITKS